MKKTNKAKTVLFTLILLGMGLHGRAQQHLTSRQVPLTIVKAFDSLFHGVTKAKWSKDSHDEFSVAFTYKEEVKTISFDWTGKVVHAISEITSSERLPGFVQDSIKKISNKFSFVHAIKNENPDGCILYDVELAEGRTITTRRYSVGCKSLKVKHSK